MTHNAGCDAAVTALVGHDRMARDSRWDVAERRWTHYWHCLCGHEVPTAGADPYWFERHLVSVLTSAGMCVTPPGGPDA